MSDYIKDMFIDVVGTPEAPHRAQDTSMQDEVLDLIYEQFVKSPQPLQEAPKTSRAKEFLLVLPKFVPTEAWGRPDSMERQQINRLFGVMGGGRTIEGKIKFLQRIAEKDTKITSPRRIISSLIILEALSAVVTSFSASSAGFVFEGFLAALLQGAQEADVSAKGNLPIQDLIAFTETDVPVPISLKLLNKTTNIEGSYTNLVDGLDEFGQMVYIVARKDGEAIAIEQFTFDQENFVDALTTTAKGGGKKSGLGLVQLPDMTPEQSIEVLKAAPTWEERYELLQHTAGYSERVREKRKSEVAPADADEHEQQLQEIIREEWNMLTENKGGTQWAISPAQLKSFQSVGYKFYGELPYAPARIEQVAIMHMDKLNGELTELFSATQSLSENINKYFTFDKRARAINSGEKAIADSVEIQRTLTSQLQAGSEPEK